MLAACAEMGMNKIGITKTGMIERDEARMAKPLMTAADDSDIENWDGKRRHGKMSTTIQLKEAGCTQPGHHPQVWANKWIA